QAGCFPPIAVAAVAGAERRRCRASPVVHLRPQLRSEWLQINPSQHGYRLRRLAGPDIEPRQEGTRLRLEIGPLHPPRLLEAGIDERAPAGPTVESVEQADES